MLHRIGECLLACTRLRSINLTRNRLVDSSTVITSLIERIASHSSLHDIAIDLPLDCYASVDDVGIIRLHTENAIFANLTRFTDRVDAILDAHKGERRSYRVQSIIRPAFVDYF